MSIERHPNERIAIVERDIKHLEEQMDQMSRKVDEMHEVLLQAKGFKIPFLVLGTVIVGTAGAIAHWLLAKFG